MDSNDPSTKPLYSNNDDDDIEYVNEEEPNNNNNVDDELSYGSSGSSVGTSTISSKFTTTNDTIHTGTTSLGGNNGNGNGGSRNNGLHISSSAGTNMNSNNGTAASSGGLLYEHSHLMSGAAMSQTPRSNYSSILHNTFNNDANNNNYNNGNSNNNHTSMLLTESEEEKRHATVQTQNNRFISLLLFAVVFFCTIAIAFLASPSKGAKNNNSTMPSTSSSTSTSSSGNGNSGSSAFTNNGFDQDTSSNNYYYNVTNDRTFNSTSPSSTFENNNINDDDYDTTVTPATSAATTSHDNNILFQSSKQVFENTIRHIPFTPISRETFQESASASSIINPSLFHPLLLNENYINNNSNNDLQPLLKTPLPTNTFYTNFLLSKTTTDHSTSYPIMVYPYGYKWSPTSIQISYPYIHRMYQQLAITDVFYPDLTLEVQENMNNRFCTYYDAFSLRVRYTSLEEEELKKEVFVDSVHRDEVQLEQEQQKESSSSSSSSPLPDNGESGFEMYMVQGSPYVTMKYTQSTPVIMPLSTFKSFSCMSYDDTTTDHHRHNYNHNRNNNRNRGTTETNDNTTTENKEFGVCSKVTSSSFSFLRPSSPPPPPSEQDVTLKGVQFIMETQENLKWMVFASEPIELTFNVLSKRTIQATKPYTGVLRIALIPPPTKNKDTSPNNNNPVPLNPPYPSITSLSNSTTVQRLIYYSHLYPVGGKVSWDFRSISTSPSQSGSSSFAIRTYTKSEINLDNYKKNDNGFQYVEEDIVWDTIHSNTVHFSNTDRKKKRFHFGNSDSTTSSSTDVLSQSVREKNRNKSRTIGKITFDFNVKSMRTETPKDNLLMMALPHHAGVLPSKMIQKEFDLKYDCIKGRMTPVVGRSWTYDELLTNIEFDDIQNDAKLQKMDPKVRNMIIDQVEKDLDRVLPSLSESVYGFGKQVARLANLAKILYNFLDIDDETSGSNSVENAGGREDRDSKLEIVASKAANLLYGYLSAFLDDGNTDNLVYDSNFGGIVTRDGLYNSEDDFGNGWYNDHHFHYGYILYASAIMANINATFSEEYAPNINSILFDVAHNGNQNSEQVQGSFFPFTRHKAWFDGHSYASGLFPFGDGKSQESSSEAVNCYYGAYLWSLAYATSAGDGMKQQALDQINFMKLLLAMEIRSTKTYWHIHPSPTGMMTGVDSRPSYSPSFQKALMIGNLGMMDATIRTWFGNQPLYVHMINFLPVTAITKELFDPSYVRIEFDQVLRPMFENVEMAWKGYVIADKAMLDPTSSWHDATQVTSYELDSALSQSQLYYWISTMDGFTTPSSDDIPEDSQTEGNIASDSGDASCLSNEGCANLSLTGNCCPTDDGSFLGCCNSVSSISAVKNETSASDSVVNATNATDTSSCASRSACASVGLTGQCCPTGDGKMLGCCNA